MNDTHLIVDDETKIRELLSRILSYEGYDILQAADLAQAAKILSSQQVDLIICDVKLPDGSGVVYSREVKQRMPELEIILLTAFGNITDGVQAMKNGAFDYLVKGDDNERIIPLLQKAAEKARLQKHVKRLQDQINERYSFEAIIGEAPSIKEAINLARKVAASEATVLLLGETGTGKEVFAQAIHTGSSRLLKSFVAVNCSAISHEIMESELFGHKAGAFTGAA